MALIGHNRKSFAHDQLRAVVDRIERLESEKATIAEDIKDVFAEAKGHGFDTGIIRKIIAIRKKDANQRAEEEALLDTYMVALGMQPDLFDDEQETPEQAGERQGRAGRPPDEAYTKAENGDAEAYMRGFYRGNQARLTEAKL